MNKRDIDRLSQNATNIYVQMETDLLMSVGDQIAKRKGQLSEDQIENWRADLLRDLGELDARQQRIIAKYADESAEVVRQTLMGAGVEATGEFESFLSELADDGRLNQAPPIRESGGLTRIAETIADNATDQLNQVNTTLLNQSEQVYRDIVNRTANNVVQGLSTAQEALDRVASEFAQNGVPALIDKSGRKWSTEAYVNMINRTHVNNVANDMQDERFREYGVDLVEISQHAGAREKCYPYQGKIFSIDGTSERFPPLSDTSKGEVDGLFGKH